MPNIGIFTIGVGLLFGFVQFSKDGNPPYLVALADGNPLRTDSKEDIEFDAGGDSNTNTKTSIYPI